AMHRILNEKPVPVEELNPRVPAELRRILRRCLAKAPDQRVQSMKDLALQLREIVEEWDSLPASGSSATSSAGVAAPGRKARPLVFVAAGAGFLVVGALLALGLRGRQDAEPEGAQAFQTMRMSTQTSRGDVFDAALSRDGRYLAYLHGRAGLTGLRVRQVATGSDVEVVPPSEAGLSRVAFSPDGNYVYYLARRPEDRRYQALFVVPSLGGPPRERLFDVDSKVTFSPDGKRLACWRGVPQKQENVLLSFDLESSRETVLATLGADEPMVTAPAWSPDGLTIALVVPAPPPSFGSRVLAFDAATGARRPALELPDTFLSSVAWLADGSGLVGTGISLKGIFQGQTFLIGYPRAGFSASRTTSTTTPPSRSRRRTRRSPRCARLALRTSGSSIRRTPLPGSSPRSRARRARPGTWTSPVRTRSSTRCRSTAPSGSGASTPRGASRDL
ncbi:MAG TPA: hypothetical protein PKA62_01920, partial [Thermoanaerobaculia bacterium]|nr:hypothetical protein [Thermoanaerobaculia bacterium]